MVGALLGLVGNLLHPGTPNDPQGIAHAIAGSGMWVSVHTAIMVSLVLMLAGLVAIAHSISGGGAGVLARLGVVAAVAGICGAGADRAGRFAAKQLADAWAERAARAEGSLGGSGAGAAGHHLRPARPVQLLPVRRGHLRLHGLAVACSVGFTSW
jgi:hypothetical protein